MRIDPDLKEANRSKVFLAPVAVRLKGAESNLAPKKPKRESRAELDYGGLSKACDPFWDVGQASASGRKLFEGLFHLSLSQKRQALYQHGAMTQRKSLFGDSEGLRRPSKAFGFFSGWRPSWRRWRVA